jgi:F-type H+-transporting ATPase subunit alpha
VVSIYAGVNGYLDGIDTNKVNDFEEKFLSAIRDQGQDILKAIREEKDLSEETDEKLKKFLEDFVKKYA